MKNLSETLCRNRPAGSAGKDALSTTATVELNGKQGINQLNPDKYGGPNLIKLKFPALGATGAAPGEFLVNLQKNCSLGWRTTYPLIPLIQLKFWMPSAA